ncbi:hypothetical protein ACO0QE_004202 [Hanseniaspora vineae]
MPSFTSKGKSKRPKFLLDFKINEMTNIPQSSGMCYIKWSLKDGTGTHGYGTSKVQVSGSMGSAKSKTQPSFTPPSSQPSEQNAHLNHDPTGVHGFVTPSTSLKSDDSSRRSSFNHTSAQRRNSLYKNSVGSPLKPPIDVQFDDRLSKTDSKTYTSDGGQETYATGNSPPHGLVTVEASHQSKGHTGKRPVVGHKCDWDYKLQMPILMKFHVDDHRKVEEKVLVMRCYFEFLDDDKKDFTTFAKGELRKDINFLTNSSSSTTAYDHYSSQNGSLEADYRSKIFGHGNLFLNTHHRNSSSASEMSVYSNSTAASNNNMIQPSTSSSTFATSPTSSISSSSSASAKTKGRILLGSIAINISEYINPSEEMQTYKFLLQKSKVNSILSFSCQLKLARGSYKDFELPVKFSSGQLPNTLKQFGDRSPANSSARAQPSSLTGIKCSINSSGHGSAGTSMPDGTLTDENWGQQSRLGACSIKEVRFNLATPLMETLYEKTYQIPWDKKSHELDPKSCVLDIMGGGTGWKELDDSRSGLSKKETQISRSGNPSNKSAKQRPTIKEDPTFGEPSKTADEYKPKRGDTSQTKSTAGNSENVAGYDNINGDSDIYNDLQSKTAKVGLPHSLYMHSSSGSSSVWDSSNERALDQHSLINGDESATNSSPESVISSPWSDTDDGDEDDDFDSYTDNKDSKHQRHRKYIYIDNVKGNLRNKLVDTKTWTIHKFLE